MKPILRVGKLKTMGAKSLDAADGHLSRSRPTDNADPARTVNNRWLVGAPDTLKSRVHAVLEKAGIDRTKLRPNTTIANDILLTVSPAFFRPDDPDEYGAYDPAKVTVFQEAAMAFLRSHFGPRIAAVVVHLDEASPHIQAVIVPVMKREDGTNKLSGKDCFNQFRLRKLQAAWQSAMEPYGVGPREERSTATHKTVKSYYGALQAAPEVPEPLPPSPPPMMALMPGGGDLLATWQAKEVAKAKKRQKPLAAAAAKGMLYEAERNAGEAAREYIHEQEKRLGAMREELEKAQDQVALTKDQIAVLRGVPVTEVAAVLGYMGELGKRENSIDLVKRVGGFSFEEATRWLSTAFGPAAAGAATAQHIATVPIPVNQSPLTPADQAKARVITQQLDALGASSYRITAMFQHEDGTKHGKNLCKNRAAPDEPERLWSKAEVLARIPQMTAENARGGNVYVTPVDPAVYHALLDDLDEAGVAKLKADGYRPTLVTETSPGNHQAVLTVPRSLGYNPVNEWFKALNRNRGDEKIVGLEHSMRLAGFQNRKAKYEQDGGRYPFVRIIEATRGLCAHARAVITGMGRQMRGVSSRDGNPTLSQPPVP